MLPSDAIISSAKIAARLIESTSYIDLFSAKEKTVDIRQEQMELLKSLSEAGIDPRLFDLLLSTELDRNLKKRFGIAFFLATIFFTLLSYGMIVGNSIFKWGISDIAITGLIIETPIQFIGLLYIIARNLFPHPIIKKEPGASNRPAKPKRHAGAAERPRR
jgi:hypothetical protein